MTTHHNYPPAYGGGIHPFAKQLERLEDMILSGMSIPLTSWTVVNGDELVPLLDALRETLPDELRQAKEQVTQRENLLKDTEAQARQMLEETRQYAEQMVADSEIMKAVKIEAERVRDVILQELEASRRKTEAEAHAIKRAAFEEARGIVEGAEAYAANLLAGLDQQLTDCQSIVRNGQRNLQQGLLAHQHAKKTGQAPQQKQPAQRKPRPTVPVKQLRVSDYVTMTDNGPTLR
jgi:hypothetical protein